jgi:hypothetical protein
MDLSQAAPLVKTSRKNPILIPVEGCFFSPNNQSIYTNVNNVIDIDSDRPLVLIFIISAI